MCYRYFKRSAKASRRSPESPVNSELVAAANVLIGCENVFISQHNSLSLADAETIYVSQIHVNIVERILPVLWAALFNGNVNSWYQVAELVLAVAFRGEVECLGHVNHTGKASLLPASVSFIEY